MFSALFGSSGSDKADKLRQNAIDAFNSIQTPELKALQVQLDKYVQAGKLTPEQAESQLLTSNAFNSIVADPSLEGAQKQALASMQDVAKSGGLTAVDRAQLNDIHNQQNQENRSQNEATMQQAQMRGTGGTDLNTVNQLINEQGNADRASNAGTNVAAQAQARALQAMQAAGSEAGGIRNEDYSQAAQKAQAENAIDLFNKQTLNQTNLYNVEAANKAQAANLANAQAVNNANTETGNVNKTYNAQQVQQQFQDAMAKANGVAGVDNAWANDATKQAATEKGADMALTSGILQGGATALGAAFGGPAGAAAASSATGSMAANGAKPKTDINESDLPGYADGGEVCGYCKGGTCMQHGGKVPGQAIVPGNSHINDTVKAKLSPGEVVVPRSAMSDEDEFDKFMEQFRPQKKVQPIDPSVPMDKLALANLHQRVSKLEGAK